MQSKQIKILKKRKLMIKSALIINALIVLFLIITLSLVYGNSLSSKNNKIEQMNKNMLTHYQSEVDNAIKISSRCISKWTLDSDIISFVTKKNHSQYDVTVVSKIPSKNNYLFEDIDCVFGFAKTDSDLYITNTSVLHNSNLIHSYDFSDSEIEKLSDIKNLEFVNNSYLLNLSDSGRLKVLFKYDIPGLSTESLYGIAIVNIKDLTERISYDSNIYLLYNKEKCIYSSNGSSKLEDYNLIYEPSQTVHGLVYAYGQKKESNLMIFYVYLLGFLIFAFIGTFVSMFIAKLLHRPIENIVGMFSVDSETDMYDEENFIKTKVTEINEMNSKITNEVDILRRRYENDFIKGMLYGYVSESEIQAKVEEYNLNRFCGQISVIILNDKSLSAQVNDDSLILQTIKTELTQCDIVVFAPGQVVVIKNNNDFEKVKVDVKKVILSINEKFKTQYVASIASGMVAHPARLSYLYADATEYLEGIGIALEKIVVSKEDILNKGNSIFYPIEIERNILEHIKNNQFERAGWMLESIVNKNLIESKLSNAATTEFLYAIVCTFKRILNLMRISEDELWGDDANIYLDLRKVKNNEELAAKTLEIFDEIKEKAEVTRDTTANELIERIMEYIHENYQRDDMSLDLLGYHFNLSFGYISKILKKHTQINFREYLNKYRIDMAAQILDQNPSINAEELARSVGYTNISSFIRNFKRYKSISIGEYRKLK